MDLIFCAEQGSPQLRIVADKETWIEVAIVQVLPCVFEEGFREALEPDPLVYVAQFVCLGIISNFLVQNKKAVTSSSSGDMFAWTFLRCWSARSTASSIRWLSSRDSTCEIRVDGTRDCIELDPSIRTFERGNVDRIANLVIPVLEVQLIAECVGPGNTPWGEYIGSGNNGGQD